MVRDQIETVVRESVATGDVNGWKEYLLLNDLQAIVTGVDRDLEFATYVARTVLSRITWPQANEVQRAFLDSPAVRKLADAIQHWPFVLSTTALSLQTSNRSKIYPSIELDWLLLRQCSRSSTLTISNRTRLAKRLKCTTETPTFALLFHRR